jgi:hypothetical protein
MRKLLLENKGSALIQMAPEQGFAAAMGKQLELQSAVETYCAIKV